MRISSGTGQLTSLWFGALLAGGVGLCAACGGKAVIDGSSTGGTGGAGGTSTTTTTHTTSTTSSSSSTGGAGGTECLGELEVVVDNGAPVPFASMCQGAWGSDESNKAVGYMFSGGPAPGSQGLVVLGCAHSYAGSQGIILAPRNATSPGTYTAGTATYTDENGGSWGADGDPFHMTVTKLGPVGGSIEGTFQALVTHGGNAGHNVSGTFNVCRVSDMLAP